MRWLQSLRDFIQPGRWQALVTWKDHARQRGLTPVLSDWEHLYAIDPQGRPVEATYDDWRDQREVNHPRMRHTILAQAAIRYPELEHLRPVRGPGDPDCTACSGTGTRPSGSLNICWCGGLGWLPKGTPQQFEE